MCILSCPRVPEKAGVSSEATPVRAVYLLLDVMSIVKTEGEALEQLMDNLRFHEYGGDTCSSSSDMPLTKLYLAR